MHGQPHIRFFNYHRRTVQTWRQSWCNASLNLRNNFCTSLSRSRPNTHFTQSASLYFYCFTFTQAINYTVSKNLFFVSSSMNLWEQSPKSWAVKYFKLYAQLSVSLFFSACCCLLFMMMYVRLMSGFVIHSFCHFSLQHVLIHIISLLWFSMTQGQ